MRATPGDLIGLSILSVLTVFVASFVALSIKYDDAAAAAFFTAIAIFGAVTWFWLYRRISKVLREPAPSIDGSGGA